MTYVSGKFSVLQDGKTYVTRDLSTCVTVHRVKGHGTYAFESDDGMLFTSKGRYLDDDTEHPFDLIEEVILK